MIAVGLEVAFAPVGAQGEQHVGDADDLLGSACTGTREVGGEYGAINKL